MSVRPLRRPESSPEEIAGIAPPFYSQERMRRQIGATMKRLMAATAILAATTVMSGQAGAQAVPGYLAGNTNLWAGPSTDYPPVRALPGGGRLMIEGCLAGRSWCDVTFEDARGWVPGGEIAYEHEGRRAPVPELGAEVAIPTVDFSLTAYWEDHYRTRPWYRDRDKWASRDGYRGAPGPAAAGAPPSTASGYITANANLLAGPSTDYPVVTALPGGAPVIIHGCLEGWGWCDVAFGDIRGWVTGQLLAHEYEGRRVPVPEIGSHIALPTVAFSVTAYWDEHYRGRPWYAERDRWATRYAAPAAQPAIQPAASGPPSVGYVIANVNLRAGPSTGYPRVTTLPAGAAVTIHGCLEGWTWCDVVYGDLRGWVAGSYVSSEYQGQRVRVVDYGPRLALPIVTFAFGSYWDSYYRGRPWYAQRQRWAHYNYYPAPRLRSFDAYRAYRPHYQSHYRPYYRPYVEHRRWDHRPDYRRPDFRRPDYRRPDYRAHHPRFDAPRRWDRGPDRRHERRVERRVERRDVYRQHQGRGGPRGYSGGQTERDAARFNRRQRGAMPGE